MAFNGILITVGTNDDTKFDIDGKYYINWDKYNVTRNIQDLDSYRDANGILHRNALEHIPIKVEFETRENLTNTDVAEFFGRIKANFTNQIERKATITAYVPELDDYVTQDMYMADPQFKIKRIEDSTNVIKYESIRVAFIGY